MNQKLLLFSAVSMLFASAAVSAGPVKPGKHKNIDYAAVLALVPPGDPAAKDAPKLKPELKGKHPRLLFDDAFIAQLKEQAETDPVLKSAATEIVKIGNRKNLFPREARPAVVDNDTAALTQGFSNYIQLAFAYALDKNPTALENIKTVLENMLETPYWADAIELDCNMGAGNNMAAVAVLYDVSYNDLDPEFRKKVAERLLVQARRMYYLGYKMLCPNVVKYWQNDPQPNHRWHRGCGQIAALSVIADDVNGRADFLLGEAKREFEFILKYYPEDGDCHEGSGYQNFGFFYLALTGWIFDRNFGTSYLKHPGFSNAWKQQVYYDSPGMQSNMTFGDAPNTVGVSANLDGGFYLCSRLSRDKDAFAVFDRFFHSRTVNPRYPKAAYRYPWSVLLCYDPTLKGGSADRFPVNHLFADLGAVSLRDNWGKDAVAFSFKCGPYGGYRLNEFRHDMPLSKYGTFHYLNLAHDDPDANGFALTAFRDFIFHPGNYSVKKLTSHTASILFDGKGQKQEGDVYTQPAPKEDMRTFSYLTSFKQDKANRVIVEGEAGNAYPGLKNFRRSVIWMPGEYILVLDDVIAKKPGVITWNGIVPKAMIEDADAGLCYVPAKNGKKMYFTILSDQPLKAYVDFYELAGRWTNLLLNQYRFDAENTGKARFACLLDPWEKGVRLEMKDNGNSVSLKVTGKGIGDQWSWTPTGDAHKVGRIVGTRGGKTLIELTEKDVAPRGAEKKTK